jgi:two-component system, NtrC family, sensor kinase
LQGRTESILSVLLRGSRRHLKPPGLDYLKQLAKKGSLGATTEYASGGSEMVAGFAPVDLGGLLSVVEIPKATAYLTAKELLNSLLGVALLLLILSALLSFFWSRRLTRPIEDLCSAAQVVGHGNFDIELKHNSRDEIGNLATSFNQMAGELKDRDSALKVAQERLVQSEKMSAFGQLSAGIAHEVKNPLAGILGYVQLSMRKIEKDTPVHNNLLIIEKETKRCRLIIDNLMKFARQEKVAHMPVDLNVVAEEAAAIVDHQLGVNLVKLRKEFAPSLPPVFGNGNQVEQVLINLMINAQQAMDGKPGLIELRTALADPGAVEITVKDDGPGIPKEIQAKIFEPFFTTKAAGKGTRLGLSVSYGIIKDHKGDIRVESEPGQGTTFVITLPVVAGQEEPSEPVAGAIVAEGEIECPVGQW